MAGISSETRRQWIHLLMGSFGLLLHWLTWQQGALLAGLAIATNFVVLPALKLDRAFLRDNERYLSGVKLYPVVVLALIVVFRDRLPLAAGCWAILAVGDSVSNLFGRRYGAIKLPWNRAKSWAGSAAFVLLSLPAAYAYLMWTQAGAPHPALSASLALPMAAAASLAGAVVESLPIRLDDNLSIGLGTAAAMALVGAIAP